MSHPLPQTITQRKKLAQEARNDLDAYRHTANAWGSGRVYLRRAIKLLERIAELETDLEHPNPMGIDA